MFVYKQFSVCNHGWYFHTLFDRVKKEVWNRVIVLIIISSTFLKYLKISHFYASNSTKSLIFLVFSGANKDG